MCPPWDGIQCYLRRRNVFRPASLGIEFRPAPPERCAVTPCAPRVLTVLLRHTRVAPRHAQPPLTAFAFWPQVLRHGSRRSAASASFLGISCSPCASARFFFRLRRAGDVCGQWPARVRAPGGPSHPIAKRSRGSYHCTVLDERRATAEGATAGATSGGSEGGEGAGSVGGEDEPARAALAMMERRRAARGAWCGCVAAPQPLGACA